MLAGPDGDPRRGFLDAILSLMASACRFGGPRRLLGRLKVHGISKEAQARHGMPDSSHYLHISRQLQFVVRNERMNYLYFPKTTRVAGLAQTISLLCIPSSGRSRWWWGNGMLRVTLAMSVCLAIAICRRRLDLREGLRIVWVWVCLRRGRQAVMTGKLEVAVWAVHALVAVRGREGRHCCGCLCWALSGSFGDTAGDVVGLLAKELLARLGKLWVLKSRAKAAMRRWVMACRKGRRDFIFLVLKSDAATTSAILPCKLCSALCCTVAPLLCCQQYSRTQSGARVWSDASGSAKLSLKEVP